MEKRDEKGGEGHGVEVARRSLEEVRKAARRTGER
jgi:hypothetical protein